jgi:hypothetical protein
VAIGITLLVTAGNQLDYINSQRKGMNLVRNEPLENAPPSLAFATVAMGAFRGLIVDALWIRADRLKQEGQFFDARQLADWIVALQPRFPQVWAFNAWNMAYNISAAIPASQPEQRWHWVKNGYELLRDKGIPLNPTDISLYTELALIFQHKMGGITDDAHKYYKLQLAEAMAPLLGTADEQYFGKLVDAPRRLGEILADANVAQFVADLRGADAAFADEKTLVANYLALRQEPKRYKPQALGVIDNYRRTETLEKFDVFARAWQLRNEWKLEPQLMQQINRTYGPVDFADPNHHLPLDWRNPDAHAIYWAVEGLKHASKNDLSASEANTDRIVTHSLQNLYRHGKLFVYKLSPQEQVDDSRPDNQPQMTETVYLRPDLRMFEPKDSETQQTGHRNFLKNAVLNFYLAGHEQYGRRIYRELQQLYPREEFSVEYTVYLRNRLREELSDLDVTNATETVQLMLRDAYFYYAMREDDEAYGREKMAAEVHDRCNAIYKGEEHRVSLPPINRLKYLALWDFLNDPLYPVSLRMSLRARIQLERPELSATLENEEKQVIQENQSQGQTGQP